MKKLFLLLILLPFFTYGQQLQNSSLIKDGGIWREARAAVNTPPDPWWIVKKQYLMDGDTVINSITYKKIYTCDYSPSISNKVFFSGIREDSFGKVYFLLDTNKMILSNFNLQARTEYLLYDFSLNIGDTIRLHNERDSIQVLQSIDSVSVGNQYRKRWNFTDLFGNPLYSCIEGIGSINGLFFPLQFCFESSQLLTCYEDSVISWNNPYLNGVDCFAVSLDKKEKQTDLIKIYPNPTGNNLYLHFKKKINEDILLSIYNSTGQLVKQEQFTAFSNEYRVNIGEISKGVYFVKFTSNTQPVYSSKFIKE